MKKTLNIAMVGFGGIARIHYLAAVTSNVRLNNPFLLKVSHVIPFGADVVDLPDVKICSSIKEALDSGEEIDFIDICNINQAHLKAVQEAAQFGLPIYCEKPLSDNMKDSCEIKRIVEEGKITAGVPLVFRYIPSIHMLKDAIAAKELGEIIGFRSVYYHDSYLNDARRKTWRAKAGSGGGASIDLAIHMVDLLGFVFGGMNSAVMEKSIYFPDVAEDEIARYDLECKNGVKGILETSRIFHQHKQKCEIEVFFTKGSILCDLINPYELEVNCYHGDTILRKADNEKICRFTVSESAANGYHQDAHTACLSDFARKIYDHSESGYGASAVDAVVAQGFATCSK